MVLEGLHFVQLVAAGIMTFHQQTGLTDVQLVELNGVVTRSSQIDRLREMLERYAKIAPVLLDSCQLSQDVNPRAFQIGPRLHDRQSGGEMRLRGLTVLRLREYASSQAQQGLRFLPAAFAN